MADETKTDEKKTVGPKVSFFRAHDKAHKLSGTVVEKKGEEILVKTEPDGVLVWTDSNHLAK